ncbi:tape measure protein [Anabaena sp. CCY 9910]|uniref:tape measure protein n=1 Tax=Anabaena sp. CCY 9910 TaxID=3103870 RepID=UPI0039DFEC20
MSTTGSVTLELKLNRTKFDQDLGKLQQEKVAPIPVKLRLDTKDFERQIKGLTGFLPELVIPVKLDTNQLKSQLASVKGLEVKVSVTVDKNLVSAQFEEIGKQAAAGFNKGFGGDPGKAAADTLIKSVKQKLEIQSPSRVFWEIGKYAAEGLVQGLDSVSESQIKKVTTRIEGYFKSTKIKVGLEFETPVPPKLDKFKSSISFDGDITKNITSSIEQGFKSVKPQKNIFGSLTGLILSPVQQALQGVLLGIGTPIGTQLGQGIAKGVQSSLGSSIGSLELIAQRATEKSIAGIPKAQQALVETIKANPIGSVVVKQLESLQRVLERFSINLSPQAAVKSLVSEQDVAIASSAASLESQQGEFKTRKKAKAGAIADFVNIVGQRDAVDQVSKQLGDAQARASASLKKINELQAKIASGKGTREDTQKLAQASAALEQTSSEITSLRDTKKAYEEKLKNQIRLLASLGIEGDLTADAVKNLDLTSTLESLLESQKAIQQARGGIKTKAKTPESIRGKKLERLQTNADTATKNLQAELAKPDASVENIQKLQKTATATAKALDLYKIEIANPEKDIEKTTKRLKALNDDLAATLEQLQTKLSSGLVAAIESATREIVNVGNLSQIPQPKPTKGQLAIERQALASEAEAKKAAQLQQVKQLKAQQANNLPKLYVDAVQSVSQLVTGQKLAPELIPNIVPSNEVEGRGDYNAQRNTYRIRPDLYQQIQTGDIDQVSDEVIGNIVHEIFHAFQHGFGRAIADQTGQLAADITPTPEELLKLGDKIESSVAVQPDDRKPLSRKLETGANVFQLRNTEKVREELKRAQLKDKALSLGGVAGSKIGLTDVNLLIDNIAAFIKEAGNLGVDITKQRTKYIGLVKDIRAQADAVGAKSANLDNLPTIEIEEIVKQYQEILQTIEDAKTEVASLTGSLPETKSFQEELVIQNQKPQLVRAAKELGVKGVGGKNKEEIASAIVASGASPQAIKSKLPLPTVPTEKILAEAQKLLQLPSQELEKSTKYAVNNFGLKLKAIAKNPDDKSKLQELQNLLAQIDELEKTYIAVKVKSLDESVRNTLQGRILGLQKQRVAATYQLKPLVGQNSTQVTATKTTQSIRDAEVSSERKNLFDLFRAGRNDPSAQAKRIQEESKRATENFQKIFAEVARLSGIDPQSVKAPSVAFLDMPGAAGNYDSRRNRVALSKKTGKRLAAGNPTLDDIDTIAHEIRHAVQSNFGEFSLADGGGAVAIPLMSAKNKKTQQAAMDSVQLYRKQYRQATGQEPSSQNLKAVRDLEVDAVAFAAEVAKAIQKNIKAILKGAATPKPEIAIPSPQARRSEIVPPPLPPYKPNAGKKPLPVPPVPPPLPPYKPNAAKKALSLYKVDESEIVPPPLPPYKPNAGKGEKSTALVPYEPKLPVPLPLATNPQEVRALVPYESKLPAILSTPKNGIIPPPLPPYKPNAGKKPLPVPPPLPPYKPGAASKIKELADKVFDAGELLKIVADIQNDQTKSLEQKLREYDQIIQIYDDLRAEQEKQNQQLDDKFSPDKVDQQRETVKQRAKLSATLERKYGMEGLAPELVPGAIPELQQNQSGEGIIAGIKNIFKSFDQSINKRIKKRAATLALEVESAIAPSLETAAIGAKAEGRTADEKQFNKLARQARAATKGIGNLLGKNGELTDKEAKRLFALTEQLEKIYEAIGRPLPSEGFVESFGVEISRLTKNLGGLLKGAIAFTATSFLQNFFRDLAKQSFLAFVELNRLKTTLNFASGGSIGGAQNLAFVRKTVEDLKIPLKASVEGFTKLQSAARGSNLSGKNIRELFLGLSQASTVLSLSADQTEGITTALSQSISKGKLLAEEQNQLAERIPGIFGIMARAAGVTEAEFTRLRDTGQIITQDFLPKFAKQLQAEFGDAAKDAAGNAQSAIFDLENSFTSLQQGIGEGISPAAVVGLNGLSAILKGVAAVSKELGFILLGVTAALSVKMVVALQAVIAQLIATKLATGTLSGGFASLAQTVNNSFSAKLAVGIFAVLEVVNLLNQAVNTELVGSFEKASKAAQRAAEESRKAFEGVPKSTNAGGAPESSSGVGRFLDKYLIGFLNTDVGPIKGGINPFSDEKLKTYGELERDRIAQNTSSISQSNDAFLSSARLRLAQVRSRTGEVGQLPAIDSALRDAEQQRQILQADIKRNFTDKGLAIPADARNRLEAQNLRINDFNNQRAEISKPFTLDISRADRQINDLRSQIEALNSPEGIAAVGGDVAAAKLTEELKASLERLKNFKNEAETTLASLRIDPVLAFTQALRGLNLALAESTEKNDQAFNSEREAIATSQITGFSTNKLNTRNAALQNAIAERDRNRNNVIAQEKAVAQQDAAINSPEFQTTLRRLGVAPDSSVAKIDDVLKNTQDEADKGILERLKTAREQRNRLAESRTGLADSQVKVRQQVQDNALFDIEDRAANVRAKIQSSENQKIAAARNAQNTRIITEEMAAEKIAGIQLLSAERQKKTVDAQLLVLREYYAQGKISAEEFAKRERELGVEQTNFEKQQAEARLAARQATVQRRLRDIEFANRKAENAIAITQTDSTRQAKESLLTGGLTQQGQDNFAIEQNKAEVKAASDRVKLLRNQLTQTKKLREDGLLNAREASEKEGQLQQQLAQANLQLVDLKISAEEKYREIVERGLQRILRLEDTRTRNLVSQLESQKAGLDLYNQSLDRTNRLEESRFNLTKAQSNLSITRLENQRGEANDALGLVDKLKDKNLNPRTRAAIKAQLGELGFASTGLTVTPATVTRASGGTSPAELELKIKQQIARIEEDIAAKKQKALELEQEFARKSLESDLKRQKIAAETAVFDAQSAQLTAAKSKLEAEAALRLAVIKKDPEAIAIAKTGIDIANREVELSDRRLDNALKNLGIQDELTQNATQAQLASQQAATEQLRGESNQRRRQTGISLIESGGNPRNLPPTQSSQSPDLQLPKRIDINQLPELNLKKGENLFDGYMRYRDTTAQQAEAAKVKPTDTTNQFASALKVANQEVVQRLDKLIDSLSRPNLTVQTPNPVDDAAKILSDMQRGQMMSAGI